MWKLYLTYSDLSNKAAQMFSGQNEIGIIGLFVWPSVASGHLNGEEAEKQT